MKRTSARFVTLASAFCALLLPLAARAQDSDFKGKPDAGGIVIDPGNGKLEEKQTLTITFPTAMVKTEAINTDGFAAPFTITPKLTGKFLWKSQTEGEFTVSGPLAPGAHYRFALDPALKDDAGKPVKVKEWGAEFTTKEFHFTVEDDGLPSEHLPIRPEVYLDATYAVKFSDALEHIYFQDRDSHKHYASEVIINSDDQPSQGTEFRVVPREDLPVGHTYDLVLEGVRDADTNTPLPYLQVFPLGNTVPMKVNWVGAYNYPTDAPEIVIDLSDRIDPDDVKADTVKVEPAVPNMKVLAWDNRITIDGDFDTKTRYSVTVAPTLTGEHGYSLAAESKWKATFKPKSATVVFPGSQIYERTGRGLRFSFLQINAPKLTWNLAAIPPEKIAAVTARVREFEQSATDPYTGEVIIDPETDIAKPLPTELLANFFDLKTTGTGEFDATDGDKQVVREIKWQPGDGKTLSGAYLLEVSGKGADGRTVGNRSIVSFSDLILTQKRGDTAVTVRVAKMSDGLPVPDVTVRLVSQQNAELGRAVSDKQGMAVFQKTSFSYSQTPHAFMFIADTSSGPAMQIAEGNSYSSGSPVDWPANKIANGKKSSAGIFSTIITDRNLYRPSQTVKFKGILRLDTNGTLSIPAGKPVHWWITRSSRDETLAEGNVPLSADGGWDAEWEVPGKIALGEYTLHCEAAGWVASNSATFRVDEYRVPLFSTDVVMENEIGNFSKAKVSSAYFHGAANRGAHVHWKATWLTLTPEGDGDIKRYDDFTDRDPQPARKAEEMKQVEGDVVLDANGMAEIKCDAPFTDGVTRGRCEVTWRVDITSIDGQTLSNGASKTLQFVAALPGIKADEQYAPTRGVKVALDAVDFQDKPAAQGVDVQVDLYHVTSKTAKEKIAPFIYRYRNTSIYTKVGTQDAKAPGTLSMPVKDTGHYVAVATTKNQPGTPVVSAQAYVSGDEPTEFPVENETAFQITHDDKKFMPGEVAVLHTQAPFGGVAWVSVEADDILDTMLVPLQGNSGRIELPIKKEYGPNAFVSVYLVKPGGAQDLAQERFAYTNIDIRLSERELTLATKLEKETVKPGDMVRGEITVGAGNPDFKPQPPGTPVIINSGTLSLPQILVPDADVTVFAVDDAVLQLGDWSLPDFGGIFYPQRHFGVMTYNGLDLYIADVKRESLTEKGFVIGGGGEEDFQHINSTRKEFRTLAFWEANLKTDKEGKLKFEFKAPDNLTSYRIVAVGQTRKNQFGGDASKVVKISKPLIAEPALPRFLRDGDEVELRVVVRQNYADSDEITVRCVPDARLQITGSTEATQKAAKDAPVVFRFKAKVVDADLAPAVVKFDAVSKSNKEAFDSVQNSLPVHAPVILRKESVAGTFDGPTFDPVSKIPDNWKKGHGSYDLTISTTPWLPKIAGLPLILDYPHGCFDQVSSRMLSYGLLGDLLAYLPDSGTQDKLYRSSIENGLKQFKQSIMDDGMLPYWNGSTESNAFCTVEACWALDEIKKAGFDIPEELPDKLTKAVVEIALGHKETEAFTQCLALMVASRTEENENFAHVAEDLYFKRNSIGDEGRAMLALAMHQLKIMPKEMAQLMRELDHGKIEVRAFDPKTFSSTDRAEAMRALAFCRIAPANWTKDKKEAMRKQILEIMDSSSALSTQENLWLLLAFKAFQETENLPKLQIAKNKEMLMSKNGASAGWLNLAVPPAGDMTQKGLNAGVPLSYLMNAEYMTDEVVTDREDRGFRVERVVRNLTEPKRTGTAEAPFKLGDQIFITYRVFTRKEQNYIALEDLLPAGLETVNPDLPLIGKFFSIPQEDAGTRILDLSHSEMRDQSTCLYFYEVTPGTSAYSVLARATVAGTFRWPSTQIVPMYDSRFSGISPSSLCVVAGE